MGCSRCSYMRSEWYNTGDWFEDNVYKCFCTLKKRFIGYDEPGDPVETPKWCPIIKKPTLKNSKKLK